MPTVKSDAAPIITLTTDFGLQDHYVSAMKAVMLGINPATRFIDISHNIPPHDVMAAAWILHNSAFMYPPNTVHLTVVDPGVGTHRKPVALKVDDQFFVGPDNGLFSLLIQDHAYEAVELNNNKYWYTETPSSTFHGRDIFSPVAAHLVDFLDLRRLGDPVEELYTYKWAIPVADRDGVQGWIIHIDRYGNLITNIGRDLIEEHIGNGSYNIYVGNTKIREIVDTFASVSEGEPVAYIGSSGMLEIAINKGNARQMLGIEKGSPINIVLNQT